MIYSIDKPGKLLPSMHCYVSILLALPAFFWMLDAPLPFICLSAALTALAIFRHRANIARLIRGEESAV